MSYASSRLLRTPKKPPLLQGTPTATVSSRYPHRPLNSPVVAGCHATYSFKPTCFLVNVLALRTDLRLGTVTWSEKGAWWESMARIEDLIDEIPDPDLRIQVAREVKHLKSNKRFGLVYEEHVPETVSLFGLPVQPGSIVHKRSSADDQTRWEVVSVAGETATITPVGSGDPVKNCHVRDLLTVKRFEEPIYLGLTPVGEVRRGSATKPFHSVINGENYHALQLLAYTHTGKVDVIYIDPPYNTGDKSWKYNNRFVDGSDSYRHSRWLAMMHRRIRMARTLLKRDGVLIVTIDEHEVNNLGLLLKQELRNARIQMVTIVTNTAGSMSPGRFSRAEEYAFFSFFGEASPHKMPTDLLSDSAPKTQFWFPLFRSRGVDDMPSKRPNMVYPIGIDPDSLELTGTGPSLKDRIQSGEVIPDLDSWVPDPAETVNGYPAVWPILDSGEMTRWQLSAKTLVATATQGFVRVRKPRTEDGPRAYTISYVKSGNRKKVLAGDVEILGREESGAVILQTGPRLTTAKTTWKVKAHDARLFGTTALRALIGTNSFSYPKSPYAVADTLATVLSGNKHSVVLDFFAGSGTTLQAVAMLNAQDGGDRQCILVTNNDVSDAEAETLNKAGHFVGDPDYEAQGIFEAVTKPRVEAAITGIRPDGEPVEGSYLEAYLPGHELADGLNENVAFFRMDYLEPDLVELGRQYEAIAPLLWMAAGSVGSWEAWDGASAWSAPQDSSYAVLFDGGDAAAFSSYVRSRSEEITHAWIVTDSHSAFLELQEELPEGVVTGQLYRDYLRNFVVNAPSIMR